MKNGGEREEINKTMPKYCNLMSAAYPGEGKYGIPKIEPVYELEVNKWLGFNYVKSYSTKKDENTGVHFFLDDYQFERVWNTPDKYLKYLSRYDCVLSPDFSLYTNFPKAVQIYNHYRKHWLAAYWRENGITVIPTIAWSDSESFEWCFDGEPINSIVAVSNVGCVKNKEARKRFDEGYKEMLTRLHPKLILFYCTTFGGYEGNVRYIRHKQEYTEEI